MKRFPIFVVCILVCFAVVESPAETYQGIYPLMKLGDVKKVLPGAKYEKRFPAWAKEEDALYSVTGEGIEGEIIIKFSDIRVWSRKDMEGETDNNMKDYYRAWAERPDDDALYVSWVRWVPDEPFPVDRIIKKYGKPEKSDFAAVNFKPYKQWTSKGIYAHLSDDGKKVVMIDFTFTSTDYKESADIRFKSLRGKPPGWNNATPIESDISAPGREEPHKKEVR